MLAIFLLSSFSVFGVSATTVVLSVGRLGSAAQDLARAIAHPRQAGDTHALLSETDSRRARTDGSDHGFDGPEVTASGKTLKWRRDLQEGFAFHVEVPAGESEVTANLDYASPASFEPGYSAGLSATEKLYIVNWNTLLLYPAGFGSDQLTYSASLRLPARWQFGTSLHVSNQAGSDIHFAPVSLTMLVDGPGHRR